MELQQGRPFKIHLESGSSQWEALRPEYRQGTAISIPPSQFHYSRAVKDQVRYVWRDGQLMEPGGNRAPLPGAVVILTEAPHQHEYTPYYRPLGPLQWPATQTRLRKYLPRLLSRAGVSSGDVLLASPIQFQTSLHRLLLPEHQSKGKNAIRDAVWKALYTAQSGWERPVEADFLHRIGRYRPQLVINACASGLRDMVTESIQRLGPYRVMGVSHHPSVWSSRTKLVQ